LRFGSPLRCIFHHHLRIAISLLFAFLVTRIVHLACSAACCADQRNAGLGSSRISSRRRRQHRDSAVFLRYLHRRAAIATACRSPPRGIALVGE